MTGRLPPARAAATSAAFSALRLILLTLAAMALVVRPAAAQSILRDAETEAFFRDMGKPLIEAAGLDPRSVEIVLVGDPSINAFVTGGQNVFFHSGLIAAADNVNQIQGVFAHELGHIAGGHSVRFSEGTKVATGISLLSLLLGAAAIAAGAGDAGAAIMAGGQQAAMGKFLAFNREQESRADQAGASYLGKAGLSGRGSVDFFKKLQQEEYRLAIPQDDSYGRTHPLSGDRIQALQNIYEASPYYNKPDDPALQRRFLRIKAKLAGYVNEPARTFQMYPESDQSEFARYARAYAYHKSAYPDKATAEVDKLLSMAPNDPYYLELKGQILLESGKVKEALEPLRLAVKYAPNQPLIATLLGHALISTEDPKDAAEAKGILRAAVARDNRNPFAWYQLGIAYAREGDEARAALASAERYNLEGVAPQALASARRAMQDLQKGTPDYLRAQDIAMVSEAELREKKRR